MIARSALQLILAMLFASVVCADPNDCTGTPPDAVTVLPEPLGSWGQIVCSPYGHVLAAKDGWLWTQPASYSPVFIPSQMVQNNPAPVGNQSYFKALDLTKVEGQEFQEAYAAFHTGLDSDPTVPVGYRLDAISVSGKSLKLYFFDYGDHAWGVWCNHGCDSNVSVVLSPHSPDA